MKKYGYIVLALSIGLMFTGCGSDSSVQGSSADTESMQEAKESAGFLSETEEDEEDDMVFDKGTVIESGDWNGLHWEFSDTGYFSVTGNMDVDDTFDWDEFYWGGPDVPWIEYREQIVNASLSFTGAKSLKYFLYFYINLENADLSELDTSNVTDMGNMFTDCCNLTRLNVSNFDTSNVTDMSGMFGGCLNLTKLDISNFDTSSVTDMRGMFYECQHLQALDLSNFDTSNVTNMTEMFQRCSHLTDLDVSSFDTGNVMDMSRMFDHCSKLKKIIVGKNWSTDQLQQSNEMFRNCGTSSVTQK